MSPSDSPLEVLFHWPGVVLYILTVVVGLCGNAAVIYLSVFKTQTKVTNVFLENLAVADLIFYFSRILSVVSKLRFNDWPFGTFVCKLNGFIKYTNMFCSVFLLAVISLDRALCVWRPFFIKTRRTHRVARVVAVCVWTLAVAHSVPFYIYRHLHLDKNNRIVCNVSNGIAKDRLLHIYLLRFVCGFLLPFLVILVCYILTGVGIVRAKLSRKSRSLRILTILVLVFFLCWAPYHCGLLIKFTHIHPESMKPWATLISVIGYFNSCVNPLLYFCLGGGLGQGPKPGLRRIYSRARKTTPQTRQCLTKQDKNKHKDTISYCR